MREYEIVAFVKENAASKDPVKDAATVVSDLIKQHGGETVKADSMGRKPIGYLIQKQKEAQLVISVCRLKPDAVAPLNRSFLLNASVLTATVCRKEAEGVKLPPQDASARPVKKPTRGRVRPLGAPTHSSAPYTAPQG